MLLFMQTKFTFSEVLCSSREGFAQKVKLYLCPVTMDWNIHTNVSLIK